MVTPGQGNTVDLNTMLRNAKWRAYRQAFYLESQTEIMIKTLTKHLLCVGNCSKDFAYSEYN